ncbi:hypothetical protein K438DRAFT_1786367 [Mycena galopus ATCC 62051]|nr:hypothetical protein K438DRAFT_1786367 [Mycena galopus ATCC 62051]
MFNPPQNSAPGPSMPRKTKPRVALPGTSRFSVDADSIPAATSSAAPETIHAAAPDSGLRFRAPITPASAPRAFTCQADVNTLGGFVRTDAPVLPRLKDPREPFDESPDLPDFSALHSFHDSTESCSKALSSESPFTTKPRSSEYEKIDSIIQHLLSLQIPPFQLILQVLNPNDWHYDHYRNHLYRKDNTRLSDLVEAIMRNENEKRKLLECMRPYLLDFACSTVAEQMEERQATSILSGIGVITSEFIDAWNIEEDLDVTPFLTRILETAAQTERITR